MTRTLRGMLALVALLFLPISNAMAQVDRATLSGVVRDSGGGVLPGATVTVTNLATNLESQQQTTETGGYQVVNLIPGKYRIDVELSGFKKSSQVVTLEVGQRARLDVELAVGSFSETVVVAESPQLLNTNDATLGDGHSADAGGEPAAGHPQLGRPAGARARRAGRPLHRAGRRHLVRPHRRHQRARRPRAAEQLPARRRGQQQHLRERPGADDAGVAAVGGRDSGIQGRHQPVLGRVRPVAGRGGQRLDQVGHQRLQGHALRLLPQPEVRHHRLLLGQGERGQAGQRSEPVRRQPRRADREGQGVLLRRLRGHADHARRHAPDARADGRRARRHLHLGGEGSADRPAVRQQHDSAGADRSVRGRDHRSGAAAEPAGRQQLLPHRRPGRQRRPAADPSGLEARRRATASSAATSTRTARARSPARSAASSTAPARRRSATRRSRPTRSSAAGRA